MPILIIAAVGIFVGTEFVCFLEKSSVCCHQVKTKLRLNIILTY